MVTWEAHGKQMVSKRKGTRRGHMRRVMWFKNKCASRGAKSVDDTGLG